jgi:hypothetical protein
MDMLFRLNTDFHVLFRAFLCRYDVRSRLEDKNKFGLKSNLPYRPTAEEVELEEELDRERYLALENDDMRVAEQEGECVSMCMCKQAIVHMYVHA